MPTRLTDLEFDEISVVERGANQKSKIVLFKMDHDAEDRSAEELDELAEMLSDPEDEYSDLQDKSSYDDAAAITKAFEDDPQQYDAIYSRAPTDMTGDPFGEFSPKEIAETFEREPSPYDAMIRGY
jgi:hypothetical protein